MVDAVTTGSGMNGVTMLYIIGTVLEIIGAGLLACKGLTRGKVTFNEGGRKVTMIVASLVGVHKQHAEKAILEREEKMRRLSIKGAIFLTSGFIYQAVGWLIR